MFSLAEENYLKTLFLLADEQGETTVNDLSRKLGIKMPTVNSMMKKLSEKNLVHYESYKPMHLTAKGLKAAALIVRKHRLTEMYLVEKMGFAWDEVHDIAEQVEHIKSDSFFERMDLLLGNPKLDPHGSPIPDKDGHLTWLEYLKLSDVKEGETVKLAAVTNSNDNFLRYLSSIDLKLGLKLTVKSIDLNSGQLTVSYGKKESEILNPDASEKLLVERI